MISPFFFKIKDAVAPIVRGMRQMRLERLYTKHILRIRKQEIIRVLFWVNENSKWCSQSLYDALTKDKKFFPFIVVSSLSRPGQNQQDRKTEYEENVCFFRSRGMNVFDGYDVEKRVDIDLSTFAPDVVFYQQPWGIAPIHDILNVAKFALTCYIPYGVLISNLGEVHYYAVFQRYIWKTFAISEVHKNLFRKYAPNGGNNVVVANYPKLDVYLDREPVGENIWSLPRKGDVRRIIWAPHYAFIGVAYGTFTWNHEFLLNYARNHPDTDWIVKPHPRLKAELVARNIMPLQEVRRYFKQWKDLPNAKIYEQGDYFGIMRTSDAMITDSCSFLAEYLPTGKPILHLINPNSVGFNEIGNMIIHDLYKIYNVAELENTMQRVVFDKDDFLKEERLKALCLLGRPGRHGGEEIRDFLSTTLAGDLKENEKPKK